jgi:hypothetical protein
MSSPGACANGRVGVGHQPIQFTAIASIRALGSTLFVMSQVARSSPRHGATGSIDAIIVPIQKARDQFPGAGSILATLNICR